MTEYWRTFVFLATALILAACDGSAVYSRLPVTTAPFNARISSGEWLMKQGSAKVERLCPDARPGWMQCLALIRTDITPQIKTQRGLTPQDFQQAYNLPSSSRGSGEIVAIVDAYDNPNIASDLNVYRARFGLPAVSFTKYNQEGQISNYPAPDPGWGGEEDLDVDMVSATCPNCTIYLLEANSSYISDLTAAEAEAVALGAHIVSNSWGGFCTTSCGYGSYFDAPGVVYLASAGDGGYRAAFPMDLSTVVSVGGTTLLRDKNTKRGWIEAAWSSTGGGCSGVLKPSWQHDPGCIYRTANDVSADADSNSGPATYDSYKMGGWAVAGGTSVSSPLVAGIYGLAGNASSQDAGKRFWTMTKIERRNYLNSVTLGTDGSCNGSYLCQAGTKQYKDYSGPAGWGTPRGIGAF